MHAIPLAGIGLVLLFLILNLTRKHKDRSVFFLSAFFLLVGAEQVYRYMKASGSDVASDWMVGLDLVYWILLGPVIYGYSRSMVYPEKQLTRRSALHLIPLCIVLIPYSDFLLSGDGTQTFFSFAASRNIATRMIIFVFWEYCVLGYLAASVIMVLRNRRILNCFFSSRRKKELTWLIFFNGGFAANILAATLVLFLMDSGILRPSGILTVTSAVVLNCYLLGIGVFGYRQAGIFSSIAIEDISNARNRGIISPSPEREFKYRKSGLQDDESKILLNDLTRLMKTDAVWMDCELNIQDLASQMNTSVHKLSQAINEHFGQNFYDYINTFRLAAVKKMLVDPVNNDQKIMSIAYDCGFNSKSAFYAIFKKATGISPSEFRRKNQPELTAVYSN